MRHRQPDPIQPVACFDNERCRTASSTDNVSQLRHFASTRVMRNAVLGPGRWLLRSRVARVIAVFLMLVLMTAIVTLTAVFTYRHASAPRPSPPTKVPMPSHMAPPPNSSANLSADFAQLETSLHAKMGVAVSAVGDGQAPMVLGDWEEGPAWSTIKVPLVIAAYRQQEPPRVNAEMKAAITESDNASAESVWASLGDPVTAAKQVQEILRETGDPTTVQSRKLRPEFSAFGQTIWPLLGQVRFAASAFCNSEDSPIFSLMSQVEPDQRWGIGNIPDTPLKGGWGPSSSGKYLVRQFGVLTTAVGKLAVAVAAEPASGSFDDGTHDLGEVARWLMDHVADLPAGQCGH
jgi:hypothetical protein